MDFGVRSHVLLFVPVQLVRPEQAEEDLPRMSCKSEGYARSELLGEADGRGPHETEGDTTR